MIPTKPVTEEDIDQLNALLQKARELHCWKRKQRYYHLVTVENFITHLPTFKDRRTRLKAFHHIRDYLLIIAGMDALEELDVHRSRKLYMEYLDPLVPEFTLRLGFIPYTSLRVHIVILLIVEAVAFSLQWALWIKLLLALLFFGLSLRQSRKQQQKRVCGIFV